MLLSHGGGALSWILPRLQHAYALGPLKSLFANDPAEIAKSFYYDTVLYDRLAMQYLADKVGTDRLVVGSDYPFTIKQDQPTQFAEKALPLARDNFCANARRLLGLGQG
jgi:aminocarboxymuconate-semialdehyde decarboxylase